MATNTVRNTLDLVNNLLDRGYTQATEQVIQAMTRNHENGILEQRLKEFEAEAARLGTEGKALTADNAVFRALMADFETTLKRDAGLMDAASPDVQASGVGVGGTAARELSLPGLNDAQLATLGIGWNRPDPEAINQVVNYVNTPAWRNELDTFGEDLLDSAAQVVVGGIASGQSPLATARELRAVIGDLSFWKANNLLRTVQLTSYRDAMSLYYQANSDILEKQIRVGTLDGRICLCCLALHGTEMAVGERVDDHHHGRCASIGIVKGREWSVRSGQDYYNSLSEAQQIDLAGYANWNALKNGAVSLNDFVQGYTDPVFGQMFREASLKSILGNGAGDYYKRNRGGSGSQVQ